MGLPRETGRSAPSELVKACTEMDGWVQRAPRGWAEHSAAEGLPAEHRTDHSTVGYASTPHCLDKSLG